MLTEVTDSLYDGFDWLTVDFSIDHMSKHLALDSIWDVKVSETNVAAGVGVRKVVGADL